MRPSTIFGLGLALLTLAGCGGSDGGSGLATGAVPVRFSVSWPLRSLAFNAPASAQSALLRLPRGREDAQDAVVLINRNGGPAAYEDSIVSVDRARVGTYECRVEFYAGRDGSGALVALAGLRVNVDANGELVKTDGTPLGNVAAIGQIKSVLWNGGSGFLLNEPVPASVVCFDAQSNLIAVSPGSIFVDVVSGTGTFNMRPDGTLVSTSTGAAGIRFRADGVSSDLVDATTVGVERIAAPGEVVAVQPNGKILMGSRAGKTVKEYDPSSGALLRTFNVDAEPSVIAIAKDGSRAYVGLNLTNGYKRIDLTTGQVSPRVDLDTSALFNGVGYPIDMDVDPNDPTRIVVAFQVDGSSANGGAAICKNDVQLPVTLGVYTGTSVRFAGSGTVITQAVGFSPATTRKCTVDANGLTEVDSVDSLPVGEMVWLGGKIVSSGGGAFDPTTLQLSGTFWGGSSICAHPASGTAYAVSTNSSNSVRIVAFRPSTGLVAFDKGFGGIGLFESPFVQTQPDLAVGPGMIAFRSNPNEVVVVSGLP